MFWPEKSRRHYDMRRDVGVDGLIAYSGKTAVGIYSFFAHPTQSYPALGNGIFVHPSFRRRGIADQLLDAVIVHLKAGGYRSFEVGAKADRISLDDGVQNFLEKQASRPGVMIKRDAQGKIEWVKFNL